MTPSPLPSTPVSNDVGRISSDETDGDVNSGGKIFSLTQCISRGSPATIPECENPNKKIKDDLGSRVSYGNGGLGDDTHHQRSPTRQLGTIRNGVGNDNKLKKVKLKVGGVTRTIQAKNGSHGASGSGSSTKSSRPSDASRSRQKLTLQSQDNSGESHSPSDKKIPLQGNPLKDFPRGFDSCKESNRKMPTKNAVEKQTENLRHRRLLAIRDFEEESAHKHRSIARVSKGVKYESVEEVGRSVKDGKKRSDKGSEDTDYEEEEELLSDGEPEGKKKQKQRRDSPDTQTETKREVTLTTRQRALLSSKEASASGVSQVEFPNGLPPPPSRKQKEKLTEVEQQLKKAEAAQRRRMQNEKAARESEAEAIRKILGQDSNRKKKEDKLKKRQEELAQERAAKDQMLASETIRIVMTPTGTVVTFPMEMGLPSIFDPKPCSYPPPREKCAGPSCLNPYKYRDSKSNLPLCSLKCYKAIHAKMDAEKGTWFGVEGSEDYDSFFSCLYGLSPQDSRADSKIDDDQKQSIQVSQPAEKSVQNEQQPKQPFSLASLTAHETRDVELVHLLLAAAEDVSRRQYDVAANLISRCMWTASHSGNPVQRLVFYFAEALKERIDRETTGRLFTAARQMRATVADLKRDSDFLLRSGSVRSERKMAWRVERIREPNGIGMLEK
nr:stress response protein NST1-like isoform X2 [Ipomoea batatas]